MHLRSGYNLYMEVERAIRKVLIAIIATLLVSVFEGNDKQTIINLFQENVQ